MRFYHEAKLRHCYRCKRRTLGVCDDCGRATCLDCKIIETVCLGGWSTLRFMCLRCRFTYRSEDLGANSEVWHAIVRRIQATSESFLP